MIDTQKGADPQGAPGDSRKERHPIVEKAADLTMLARLANHPEWRLPPELYDQVPQEMGAILSDAQKSPRAKMSAAKVLIALHSHNVQDAATALTTQHKLEQGRPFQLAVRPFGPDDRPVAFLEDASQEDLQASCEVLLELGIIEQTDDGFEPVTHDKTMNGDT